MTQASAWAAQLWPSYASGLKLVGDASGGVPANLFATATNLNGGTFAAFLLDSVIGLNEDYPAQINLAGQTNAAGQPVYDTNADPGLQFGGAVANTVAVLTNSIGTVSVQNIVKGTAAIPYEGVPYSISNVINGSYPLWGYEHYYYVTSPNTGTPSGPQLAVINALYQQVTNASFQVSSVFTNKFIPNSLLRVHRNPPTDGGPIFLGNPTYGSPSY